MDLGNQGQRPSPSNRTNGRNRSRSHDPSLLKKVMQFEGALIREQGVEFAVVVVKRFVLSSPTQSNQTTKRFQLAFSRPVVLMAQDSRGIPEYRGRRDLVNFLASVPMSAIPWKRFTI